MTTIFDNPIQLALLEADREKARQYDRQCILTFDCFNCHVCPDNPEECYCIKNLSINGKPYNGTRPGNAHTDDILRGLTAMTCRTCEYFDMGLKV